MTKLQSIALYLIALFLVADFVIAHLLPGIALALNERTYLEATQKCHESQSNWEQSRAIGRQLDEETAFALEKSAEIALMECYEKEALRHDLLAQGVSAHELSRIELKARSGSHSGLWYFVRGIASET